MAIEKYEVRYSIPSSLGDPLAESHSLGFLGIQIRFTRARVSQLAFSRLAPKYITALSNKCPQARFQPSSVTLRQISRNNVTKPTQVDATDSMDARSAVAAVKVRRNAETLKIACIQVRRSYFRPPISLKTCDFGMVRPNNRNI
jgi:hypothetical protein